jgi:hypothetical protein
MQAMVLVSYMSITHRRYTPFLPCSSVSIHQASSGGIARKRGDAYDESRLIEPHDHWQDHSRIVPGSEYRIDGRSEVMKFLVTSKVKDVFYMLPDEQRLVIMGAAMAYADKLIKEGKISEVHVMPAWGKTVMISDVESHDEASRISLENPLYNYSEMESYALVEWHAWRKQVETAYRQLAAAKK